MIVVCPNESVAQCVVEDYNAFMGGGAAMLPAREVSFLHVAASSKELEAAFHVGGTELRRAVNRLRCDGHPICSADAGYFYAARRLEVRATVAQLTGRISKIAAAAKGLLQSYEETEG